MSRKIRILAVDDEKDVLEIYQGILSQSKDEDIFAEIDSQANKLYGEQSDNECKNLFELVTCQQAEEALEQVKKAQVEGKPFSVAFIDVRMPPGPDGVWLARKIHRLDSCMNIVIVTAYSDIPPKLIAKNFKIPARLFYIQKPFHSDEIHQFATALSENWKILGDLRDQSELYEELVENQASTLNSVQQDTRSIKEKLSLTTQHVEDVNTALRVLLGEKERERRNLEENIIFNINEHVKPLLLKLEKTDLTERQKLILSTVEKNLVSIVSPFSPKIATKRLNFTPVELQVANLIKHGSSTKEIADMLNLSVLTIESYRKNIRKKMGLTNAKQNLRTSLMEYL